MWSISYSAWDSKSKNVLRYLWFWFYSLTISMYIEHLSNIYIIFDKRYLKYWLLIIAEGSTSRLARVRALWHLLDWHVASWTRGTWKCGNNFLPLLWVLLLSLDWISNLSIVLVWGVILKCVVFSSSAL